MTNMGIGKLGTSEVRFIRKWRWILSGVFPGGTFKPQLCKIAARPGQKEEDGNVITSTFYDCANCEEFKELYTIIGSFHNGDKWDTPLSEEELKQKLGKLKLELHLGDGTILETWDIEGVQPISINWGELDHSNTDCTIEITWKYEKYIYTSTVPKKIELPVVPITQVRTDQTQPDQQKSD